MERRNLDFEIPLTREQWLQIAESANFRPDYGVMQWEPSEPEVIHLSIRANDAPEGWTAIVPPENARNDEREVALLHYNDGRPFAQLEPPAEPAVPAVSPQQDRELQVELERWVRAKWQELLRVSGLHYESGVLPATEPNPPR